MAVESLAKLSEDKIKRQAYQRRLDELHAYEHFLKESEENKRRAEEYEKRAEEYEKRENRFIKYMVDNNFSMDEITRATGLSEKEIMELMPKSAE